MRFHTRFVVTPTGKLHIFHALLVRINRVLAHYSGGSFVLRFENTLATQAGPEWRSDRIPVCEDNLRELEALGLGPTPPAVLRDLGLPPNIGVRYQYGGGELAQHYWRLWRLNEDFGEWPAPYLPEQWNNQESVWWNPAPFGGEHPYVVLLRVVEDLTTGRNLIIRGEDLLPESALYSYFAQRILRDRERLPAQCYLPRWGMVNEQGQAVSVSGSDWRRGAPGFLCDVLEAGRTADELFEFLDRHMLARPLGDCFPAVPRELWSLYKPDPLPLKAWYDFIWAGHQRKLRRQEVRGQ